MLLQLKDCIIKQMMDPSAGLKMLFATEAFGMGVNIPDIRRIVHAGIPSTVESKQLLPLYAV